MSRTIKIDPDKVDRGTVEAIVLREMEENSQFNVEASNMGQPGSTTFKASMDTVNVMEIGGQTEVNIDAPQRVEDAIVNALRSQESSRSRGSMDRGTERVPEPDATGRDAGVDVSMEEFGGTGGEVAAEMTLMEDGTLEVQYPDGTSDTLSTRAGFFLTGDRIGEMSVGLSFYEDNFDASNEEIREAINDIRTNLREESESSDRV